MAFDQNSVPKDLRPLNIVRNAPEDPRIAPVSSGFYTNAPAAADSPANTIPTMYYQTTVQDPSFIPFGYNSNAISGWVPHVVPSQPQQSLASGSAVSSASGHTNNSGDDSVSGRKVKFLCSFDGKILPRLSDGALRYVGGQTRIISVRRDISFREFIRKMMDIYEAQDVVIKYQLPDEDLDALVSVSCPDDLENMMDEYEKLTERSLDGHSAKLRIFLFSPSELENAGLARIGDLQEGGQRYVEAVNGIMDGFIGRTAWKGSIDCAISAQNSDVSANNDTADNSLGHGLGEVIGVPPSVGGILLPKGNPVVVPSIPVSNADPVVRSGPTVGGALSKQEVTPNVALTSPPAVSFQKVSPYVQSYMEPHQESTKNANFVQVSPQMGYAGPSLGPMRPVFSQPPQQFAHPMHMTMNPAFVQPQHVQMDQFSAEQGYNAHPTQIPTQGGIYNWHQISHPEKIAISEASLPPQQVILSEKSRFEDCHMCQKALPHAHSDPIAQEQRESPTSNISDIRSIYSSIHFDGRGRPMVRPIAPGTMAESNVQQLAGASRLGIAGISGNPESGDIRTPDAIGVTHNVEGMQYVIDKATTQNPELPKATLPQGMVMASGGQYPYGVLVANTPQPVQNPNFQPHLQVVQDGRPLLNDDFTPIVKPLQTNKDHALHESPNAYTAKVVSGGVPTEEPTPSASDNLKQIDERLENLRIRPSEVLSTDESRKEDAMENRSVHNNHAAETISPVSEWMDNIAWSQPKTTGVVVEADISSSISPSYGVRDIPDNSTSLFSNQDPWNMRPDTTHSPPPKPNKIQIRKDSGLREENRLTNSGEVQRDLLLETSLDHSLSNKGSAEELIKQELRAVAEGVAASVLHSSIPSNVDDPVSASPALVLQNGDFQPSKDEIQHKDKLEEIKTKLSEKTNLGVPASDMGRLQIIRNSDLEELRELGSGTFGTVYHGKWRGTDVAIKRINERCFAGKPSEQDRMRDDFWNEAIKLADLHHPNVVAFYGVVLDGPNGSVATVTEYMVNGSLRNSLQKNERNLDKRKRLLIGMDVAFGMEYLHGKNIVHFDLKSDNLLVNLRDPHRPICKVGDLGLSKVKCQTLISGGVRGTLPWMAPELLNGSSSLVSEKVDVFSFGIVMWELLTGEEPYADLHYGAIIGGIVSNTLRPHVPESCDPDWRSLMERCWSPEPSERPNFTDIANELRTMASKLPSKGQAQQQLPSTSPQPKS